MTNVSYIYDDVKVVKIVDGDSVHLRLRKRYEFEVDFGFKIKDLIVHEKETTRLFRLAGIDTPELRGEKREEALKSKAELARLLSLGKLTVETHKAGKYGRYLVTIHVEADGYEEPLNVNDYLVKQGFAEPYRK